MAEYTALVKALEAAKKLGAEHVTVYSDSELMVRQLSGAYKVKSEAIRPLFEQVNDLRSQFDSCLVRHVMRQNESGRPDRQPGPRRPAEHRGKAGQRRLSPGRWHRQACPGPAERGRRRVRSDAARRCVAGILPAIRGRDALDTSFRCPCRFGVLATSGHATNRA